MWTRNDDMRHGRMRPASHHKVRATCLLGNVIAYEHRHATLPVDFSHGLGEALSGAGFNLLSAGATQTVFQLTQKVPYSFGVATQLLSEVALAFPTGSWRSIYSGQTSTVNEIMVDEIARALHVDPLTLRRQKLTSARALAVLNEVAAVGQWGRAMPAGTAQGRRGPRGVQVGRRLPRRDRLPGPGQSASHPKGVCAVDVGARDQPTRTRGPDAGRAHRRPLDDVAAPACTSTTGRCGKAASPTTGSPAWPSSPHDVDVVVMPPTGEPGGAGELGFPAAAAAVANAYARATGTTVQSFPIAG